MAIRIEYDNDSFGQTYIDSNGEEVYVSRGKGFEINAIAEDTDTDELYYSVETSKLGRMVGFEVSKSEAMDANKLKKRARDGLDINDSNKFILPEVFQQKEDEFVDNGGIIEKVHSQAGVKLCKDANGNDIYVFAGNSNPVTGSRYTGKFDLVAQGNRDTWFGMVRSIIRDSVEIMFVIALAFSAIILGVLKGKVDIDNLIIHLRGDSSSGKTTMLNLAISVYGNPDEKAPDGLISSWNGTKNAIPRRLMSEGDGLGGMLFGMDEFSMIREKNISDLMYTIASGIERERLTRSAETQPRMTGTYIVLSTGEASILSKTNGNIGLAMRILEMDSHIWTKDSKQSEYIKQTVKANYGFAAEEFGLKLGRWIQVYGMDALIQQFEDWRTYYCDNCFIRERRERMSGRYALILLAADFAKEFFDFAMDTDKLCDFIITNESSNAEQREGYADLYNKLTAYLVANMEHFIQPERDVKLSKDKEKTVYKPAFKEVWGMVDDVTETIALPDGMYAKMVAYVTIPFFDEIIINKLGYEDAKAIKKWLKKQGYSKCEGDRDYFRKTIDHINLKCIAVYLPSEEDQGAIFRNERIKKLLKSGKEQLRRKDLVQFEEAAKSLMELKEYLTDEQRREMQTMVKNYQALKETHGKAKMSSLLDDEDTEMPHSDGSGLGGRSNVL